VKLLLGIVAMTAGLLAMLAVVTPFAPPVERPADVEGSGDA